MKKTSCSRSLITLLAVILVTVLLSICTAALSYRQGAGADDNNNPADQTSADTVTAEADMPADSTADTAVTDGAAPPDSQTTAPGTGEFADDTSNVPDAADPPALNAPSDGTAGDAESALDNLITDAENAVGDAVDGAEDMVTGTSRFGIWGIVIAVAVIAALSVLLFAMFSKK